MPPHLIRPATVVLIVAASTLAVGATAATPAATPAAAPAPTYEGRKCPPPKGYQVADCRLARHGAPDLSRQAFYALRDQEVTITHRIRGLAANPDAPRQARDWPLKDSLAQPMGRLRADDDGRMVLTDTSGTEYKVGLVNIRGRGCATDPQQDRTHPLVQIVALKARASGTQAFIDQRALDRTSESGAAAYDGFTNQRGGGTGCGPSRKPVGRLRPLKNPNVGKVAHARLGNGKLNTVTEYDAKPEFGNVLYFSSNTTDVGAGGIARGMVAVGTPVATVDTFTYCDPNSDGTLLWRYVEIRTGRTTGTARTKLYGWIPARCPARLRP